MGMVCGLTSVLDETIELVRQHPLLVLKLTCGEEEFEDAIANRQAAGGGFFAMLFGRKAKPPIPLPEYTPGKEEGKHCYLDKAWHGIHFLLTGSAWEGDEPLNFLVAAGEPIEEIEYGYGPDRVFTSAEVKRIDAALQGISKEDFESRFDPDKMMAEDIYPTVWDRPKEEDDTLGYTSDYFVELKQYIHNIAEKNLGMIVGLS